MIKSDKDQFTFLSIYTREPVTYEFMTYPSPIHAIMASYTDSVKVRIALLKDEFDLTQHTSLSHLSDGRPIDPEVVKEVMFDFYRAHLHHMTSLLETIPETIELSYYLIPDYGQIIMEVREKLEVSFNPESMGSAPEGSANMPPPPGYKDLFAPSTSTPKKMKSSTDRGPIAKKLESVKVAEGVSFHEQLVENILNEAQDSLSEWEIGFIDSMLIRIQEGKPLSEKMTQRIEEIYAERCNGEDRDFM